MIHQTQWEYPQQQARILQPREKFDYICFNIYARWIFISQWKSVDRLPHTNTSNVRRNKRACIAYFGFIKKATSKVGRILLILVAAVYYVCCVGLIPKMWRNPDIEYLYDKKEEEELYFIIIEIVLS